MYSNAPFTGWRINFYDFIQALLALIFDKVARILKVSDRGKKGSIFSYYKAIKYLIFFKIPEIFTRIYFFLPEYFRDETPLQPYPEKKF